MIRETQPSKLLELLFGDWPDTMIWSCFQKVMGKLYAEDSNHPDAACVVVGCFAFLTGQPRADLVEFVMAQYPFLILTPQHEGWSQLIEQHYPQVQKRTRFAIRKDTVFNVNQLKQNLALLPATYELCRIDQERFEKCRQIPWAEDFVVNFPDWETYAKWGCGYVIEKEGRMVSGASSYSAYIGGIEIEVDTVLEERRQHLATVACSALLLECIERGLYPSWDAHNIHSVQLAEKLGYVFSHEYIVYEYIKP